MFGIAIFVGFIIILLLSLWKRITSPYQHIPSFHYAIPFIGNTFRMADRKGFIKFFFSLFEEVNSKTGVFWIFTKANVFSSDVKLFESILKSNSLITKGHDYDLFRPWLGDGLLLSKGKKWKTRRHMLTPAFHFNILESFAVTMNRHAKGFVTHLQTNASGSLLEVSSIVKHFTLDLLCETTMGIKQNSLSADENSDEKKYINAVTDITDITADIFRKPWFHSELIFKLFGSLSSKYFKSLDFSLSFTKKVIEDRILAFEKEDILNSTIFLDILIASYKRNEIDVEGIIEEVNTFMFEGHDTVSAAISWAIYLLGRDKRVQDKVYEEILQLSIDEVSPENISNLPFLDCVIKESLRLHPSAPAISRKVEKVTVLESGLMLPANTQVFMMIYHMHRDKSVWKNALSFIPERFLEKEYQNRNPFSYIPFSAGPRNCIGQRYAMMELKIVMFHLIKNFQFESTQAENELGENMDGINRAENGIWMKIYKR